MANIPNRHTFRAPQNLVTGLGCASVSELHKEIKGVGYRSLNLSTFSRLFSMGTLLKAPSVETLTRGLSRVAANRGVDPSTVDVTAVTFNSVVVGLGAALSRAMHGNLNEETHPVENLAAAVGVTPAIILAAASGRCVEVPEALAKRIAEAAAGILHLSAPLKVRVSHDHELRTKPIGGRDLELGKKAHECPETQEMRRVILDLPWVA